MYQYTMKDVLTVVISPDIMELGTIFIVTLNFH